MDEESQAEVAARRLAEIEEKISQAARVEMPPVPEHEIDAKLRDINQRVNVARTVSRKHLNHPEEVGKTYHRSVSLGLAVGYNLLGSVLAGWFLGWLFDRQLGGSTGQAIGVVVGAVVGLASVVFLILRLGDRKS